MICLVGQEEWKSLDFLGYPRYQVSSYGRITGPRGILNGSVNQGGYLRVSLCNEEGMRNFGINRLVALAFIPNPDNLPEVHHKYEKLNNRADSLAWVTSSQNSLYAHQTNVRGRKYMTNDNKTEGRSLGAMIPEDLYWEFKNTAARRKESMQEAIMHAAMLYIDVDVEESK